MKSTKAQLKASYKYKQSNVTQLNISLNKKTDSDIIGWLKSKPNKAKYIKDMIREDMEKA